MKRILPESAEYTGHETIIEFTVEKAAPSYTLPDLKAKFGQTLHDITLPNGFTWVSDNSPLLDLGNKSFKVRYTPDDTENYLTVDDIDVTLTVEKNQIDNVVIDIAAPEGEKPFPKTASCDTTGVKEISSVVWKYADGNEVGEDTLADYYPWEYDVFITAVSETGYEFTDH